MILIKTIPVGQLEANCYVVMDEDSAEAIIVDPGDEPDRILEIAEGLDVKYIVLTHAHFDHVGAVEDIKEATDAQIALHQADMPVYETVQDHAGYWGFNMPPLPKPDVFLNEGDEIYIGQAKLTVIHTPGHSPGSICLYSDQGFVLTGDTLFAGSIGRTDFPGGSYKSIRESFRKLMGLPAGTNVLSGHGPASTIGTEKSDNMFSAEFLG